EEIEKSYNGDCKKKLAHGYGQASGDNGTYKGDFKRGLPDGKGVLNYTDGSYYDGEWKKGLRDGKGKFYHSPDSVLDGYWKEDFYLGQYENAYKVISQRGPARYRFQRTNSEGNSIRFIFFRGGPNNRADVVSLQIQNDSGVQMDNLDGYHEIRNIEFPFEGLINANVFNKLQTSTYDIFMQYQIFQKGSWTITISY
ncbi:MAG: hypothetical protein AAFN93_08530, partial [Bacteroidota bacterium]